MKAYVRNAWPICIALAGACSQAEFVLPSEAEDSKASALRIAQAEVDQTAGLSESDLWTPESRVVEAYPIQGAGLGRVSYYEAKVVTGGLNAGYVLVNVDETDLLVPESATDGKTLTESYREQLGRDDLRVVRYDWFRSAAFDASGQLLAKRGFDNDPDPAATMAGLEASARAKGVFPAYSRGAVSEYYQSLKAPVPASDEIEETTQALQSREIYAELKNTFKTGWHLPQWTQPYKVSDNYPIGCGPTAWGMVYAYWRQFKGASRLFGGQDLTEYSNVERTYWDNSSFVGTFMQSCATATDTKNGSCGKEKDYKCGETYPWNMCGATKVANDLGYSAGCNRYTGSEYEKFDKVHGSLTDDRPAILLIAADENDHFPNHYVGIEAARKTQQKTIGWHDRNVSYLVNWGHGTIRKWIYVRDWGANQHELYASFSAYTLNMTLPASHGGSIFVNHEYKFHDWAATRQEADYTCARQGGRLANIGTAAENEFVRKLIPSTVSRVWIGLTKESGSWAWADGSSLSYSNWGPGEPNGATPAEVYGEMLPNGQWNDIPGTWSMPFICEWE